MSRSQSVASGVLGSMLPEGVSDTLWRLAGADSRTMPSPVSKALALQSAKEDGWQVAVGHAVSATDPEVLARLARDSRKQVRRAVAANVHTDATALKFLFDWAIKFDDEETLSSVASGIDIHYVLDALRAGDGSEMPRLYGGPASFYSQIAKRIVTSSDRSVVGAALGLEDSYTLHAAMVREFTDPSPIPGFTWGSVMKLYADDPNRCRSFVSRMTPRHIDVESAELLLAYSIPSWLANVQPTSIDDAAVEVLLASDIQEAWQTAAIRVTDPDQIDRLIDSRIPEVLSEFIGRRLEGLTTEQVERMVALQDGEDDPQLSANSVLKCLTVGTEMHANVSPEALVGLLRWGSLDFTIRWMLGGLLHDPLPGQVAALVAHPGNAFYSGPRPRTYGSPSRSMRVRQIMEKADVARMVDDHMGDLLKTPIAAELVEALGVAFFDSIPPGSGKSEYLITQLKSGIGVSPRAWEVAFGLLDSHGGSLDQLQSITRRLLKASGESIVRAPEPVEEQLSLAV